MEAEEARPRPDGPADPNSLTGDLGVIRRIRTEPSLRPGSARRSEKTLEVPPPRTLWLAAGLLTLTLLLADAGTWARRGVLPGPGTVETMAGVSRRVPSGPPNPRNESERLYGPPPPASGPGTKSTL